MNDRRGARWAVGAAMLFIAVTGAVISYNDGLFIARLAGNHDRLAYLYPLLPDGLIVICLAALYEASRRKLDRPGWATTGLLLGLALTLGMNTGAGAAHGWLDALLDGMVPVVFFVAVEVLIWHVRAGRPAGVPDMVSSGDGIVPSGQLEAAETWFRATVKVGNPASLTKLQDQFSLTRAQATKIRTGVLAESNGHATVPAVESA